MGSERETKRCEVFGYGRQALGSYSTAPGTVIRVCHECAEREEVMIGALTKPIDADENTVLTSRPRISDVRPICYRPYSPVGAGQPA